MGYDVVINRPKDGDLTAGGFNKNIKVADNQTAESLMAYGFTNRVEDSLYFCRMLDEETSFNLSVDKETLEITKIDILDEAYLQPYDYQYLLLNKVEDGKNLAYKITSDVTYAEEIYFKVNKLLMELQNGGVIEGFEVGMYI